MLKSLIRHSNIFSFDNFWKSNGDHQYTSVCGGLFSLPLLALIFILFILKVIQMAKYHIINSNFQTLYTAQPPLTSFSTHFNDPSYAPFMLGFSVNIDSVSCPSSAITFEAFLNDYNGFANSTSRTISKVPVNFETCTSEHFAMLPGKMSKVNQWASSQLNCLPINSYFQIGGSNSTSKLYKNIQFRFACPSSCNLQTCGYVEFFAASSTVNLGNASSPHSFSLNRNRFLVTKSPKYQTSYQIDSSNITSDNSLLPFSLSQLIVGTSVGNLISDISLAAGDTSTYVTIERSDKTGMHYRSYYKFFDLVAYIGGIVYGIISLMFFINYFSRIQFELNFAAQCFRLADSKEITFRGYLKQLCYELAKKIKWKLNWMMAQRREESRHAANQILDVIYLHKRIAFLQDAISLIFERHQLKGIHLLHTLKKEELKARMNEHRFRDRVVYFFGKKYKHKGVIQAKEGTASPNDTEQLVRPQPMDSNSEKFSPNKLRKQKDFSSHHINGQNLFVLSMSEELKEETPKQKEDEKPKKIKFKQLIRNKIGDEQERLNSIIKPNGILHEAEGYYSELEQFQRAKHSLINNFADNSCLKNELVFIGKLTQEELNEQRLKQELTVDMKRLVEEAESRDGNELTKRIYEKLDHWLKNYLKDTIEISEKRE